MATALDRSASRTRPAVDEPWLARVGWWATVGAALGVPVAYLPANANPYMLPKVALLLACVGVALAGVVADRLSGRRWPPRPRVAIALAAYLALTALATALAPQRVTALAGRFGRYGGLATIVLLAVVGAVVVLQCWDRPHRLATIARVVAIGGAFDAVEVVFQRFGLPTGTAGVVFKAGDTPIGALGNSNFAGAHLAIVAVVLLYLRVADPVRWVRWAASGGLVLFAAALWFTGSRGALVALVVGAAVALWLSDALGPRWLRWLATAGAVGGVVLIVAGAWSGPSGQPDPTTTPTGVAALLRGDSIRQRVDIWKGTVGVIVDHPLFGTGPDLLPPSFDEHEPAELGQRPAVVDNAHNIVLQVAATAGVPAALAWLATVVLVWWGVVRWRRRAPAGHDEPDLGPLVAGLGGAFAAYLAQGMVSLDVVSLVFVGWLLGAALVALTDERLTDARHRLADAPSTGGGSRPVGVGAQAVLVVMATLAVALAVGVVVSDRRFRAAFDAQPDPSRTESLFEPFDQARATQPWEGRILFEAARVGWNAAENTTAGPARMQLLQGALRRIEEARAIIGPDPDVELLRAAILGRMGAAGDLPRFAEADRLLRELERRDPYDALPRLQHARVLLDWARVETGTHHAEALDELDRAVSMPVTWSAVYAGAARMYAEAGEAEAAKVAARKAAALEPDDPDLRTLVRQLGG